MEAQKWGEVPQWESAKLFGKIEQHLLESNVLDHDAGDRIEMITHTEELIRFRIIEEVQSAHSDETEEWAKAAPELKNILGAIEVRVDGMRQHSAKVVEDHKDGDYIEILLLDTPADNKVLSQ